MSAGNGPTVSVGVTAQAAFVPVVVAVVAVVGLVGESPQPNASARPAVPIAPIASRRPILLLFVSGDLRQHLVKYVALTDQEFDRVASLVRWCRVEKGCR